MSRISVRVARRIGRPRQILIVAALLMPAGVARPVAPPPAAAPRTYELRNGHWFTDSGFADRTVWVVDSVFRFTRPQHVDSVIDLSGGYVVPPFGEAHNHWLERQYVRTYIARYLLDGVFYVRDLGNSPAIRPAIDSLVNKPNSVDYIAAGPGFTGPGGHPLEVINEQLVAIGAIQKPTTRQELEQYVFVVRDEADVARAWPKLLADHPDLVKVFLAYSEEYARRRDDPRFGAKRGLDPSLLPGIVRRAHAAHLRVAAHIETAADFRTAVFSGVDEVAHIPFYDDSIGRQRYLLMPADARAAAQRGVPVMTTISWSAQTGPDDTSAASRAARAVVRKNLQTLRGAGVQLLVGSDQFRHSSVVEAQALAATGVFTPLELLRLWATATPLAIFPSRHIGHLVDGYEASFLVLDGDPSHDFAATQRIRLRMKQGTWLNPSEADGQFPPLPTS